MGAGAARIVLAILNGLLIVSDLFTCSRVRLCNAYRATSTHVVQARLGLETSVGENISIGTQER